MISETNAAVRQLAVRHLYVHVPFCPSICPYCDFHVLTRRAGVVEQYLQQLEQEAAWLAQTYPHDLDTVYIGGGTPSFLRDTEMTALVGSIKRHLGWGKLENTLEINPGTVSQQRAELWRELGFDRASVGIQSLDDATLKFLGRQHDSSQAKAAVSTLIKTGFRVSGDLITAVPNQPLDSDIQGLVDLGVGHISAYTLTIEAGTEFARRGVTVTEEDEQRGFERTEELLSANGFSRYEISNYARPEQESQHNLAYWQGRTYLGLGPAASGHYPVVDSGWWLGVGDKKQQLNGLITTRRTNPHLHDWLTHDWLKGGQGEVLPIDAEEYVTDALFMGLRLKSGLSLSQLSQRSGIDVQQRYAGALAKNIKQGLLRQTADQLKATPAGWWVLNKVITDFLEE